MTEKQYPDETTHHHGHRTFAEVIHDVTEENKVALQRYALEDNLPEYSELQIHPETNLYNVPLEEFLYFASMQRELEKRPDHGTGSTAIGGFVTKKLFGRGKKEVSEEATISSDFEEKAVPQEETHTLSPDSDSLSSRLAANRALRNASWMAVFYLITTDILGPTSAPYAVSQLGYVPGSLLFVLLGVAAAYTGVLLWRMFLKLDSPHYPLKNYGDVVGRIFGKKVRKCVDVLQCLQLLCNVAVIILGNGQGLYQVAQEKVCFAVMVVIWAIAGMIVGQIKSLQRFGFLANIAIWMNLFVVFATMGVVANLPPNYHDANQGVVVPVITKAVISGNGNFTNQLQATMNIVYSYGGAMVFIELMSEMRRPWDFWKGMAVAQSIIFVCYLMFGLVVYNYQGQLTMNPANQGITAATHAGYAWQTTTNVISLVSALIAAGLYGNIGIKVTYTTFVKRLIRGPELHTRGGRITWFFLVIVYWAVAYIIASAIPQFSALTSLVGAVCILQFTYTFPPMMQFGLDMQLSAMKADGPYDPVTKTTNRIDTWRNVSRWARAYKDKWFMNTFHLIVFFASLATAALGIYASAMNLKEAYSSAAVTSFGCHPQFG